MTGKFLRFYREFHVSLAISVSSQLRLYWTLTFHISSIRPMTCGSLASFSQVTQHSITLRISLVVSLVAVVPHATHQSRRYLLSTSLVIVHILGSCSRCLDLPVYVQVIFCILAICGQGNSVHTPFQSFHQRKFHRPPSGLALGWTGWWIVLLPLSFCHCVSRQFSQAQRSPVLVEGPWSSIPFSGILFF